MPLVTPSSHKRSFVSKSLSTLKKPFRSGQTASPSRQTISVNTGHCATVHDDTSTLSTRYLSYCSALAVLSDLNDHNYRTRTLLHLNGSSLQYGLVHQDACEVIATLKDSLVNGGKVIWVGGVDSQADFSMALNLNQHVGDRQPLRELLATPNVSIVIAGASGIDINPDGTFTLTKGGRGKLDKHQVQQMLSHYS